MCCKDTHLVFREECTRPGPAVAGQLSAVHGQPLLGDCPLLAMTTNQWKVGRQPLMAEVLMGRTEDEAPRSLCTVSTPLCTGKREAGDSLERA